MRARNDLSWHGRVRVTARYVDGSVEVDEFDNLITDAGLNLMRDSLKEGLSAEIRYTALGSDATAPASTDTSLGSEQFRKPVTTETDNGTGSVVHTTYISPGEANDFVIEEIGWFAGADASDATDSGVLVARVNYSRDKTDLESLQIDRTDTLV